MENNNRCIFHSKPWLDFDKLIRGKNINFLIGSGASVGAYPTLSLSSELKNMILEGEKENSNHINSFEDLITSDSISQDKKEFLYFYFFHNWIKKMFNTVTVINQENEENQENKENKEKYKKNLKFYTKFIQKMFIFLQNESNDRPKRMNIFTTNYDLFFELAYDKISHSVPLGFLNDGSKGMFNKIMDIKNFNLNISHSGFNDEYRYEIPTLNLLKMHGSISWIKHEIPDNKNEFLKVENNFQVSKLHKKLDDDYNQLISNKIIKFFLHQISKFEELESNNGKNQFEDKWQNLWNKFNKIINDKNLWIKTIRTNSDKYLMQELEKILDDTNLKKELYEIDSELRKNDFKKLKQTIINKFVRQKFNQIIKKHNWMEKLKVFNKEFSKLYIVNPDKNKFSQTIFQQHYYQVLRSFSYELEKMHTVLIVFGFSFKDEHIKNILERSLSNPTLTVYFLPFDNKSYTDVCKLFPNYDNFKFLLCHEQNCSSKNKFRKCIQEEEMEKEEMENKKLEGNFNFLIEGLFEFIKVEKNE